MLNRIAETKILKTKKKKEKKKKRKSMGTKNLLPTFIVLLALASLCSLVLAIRAPDQLNLTSKPNRKAIEIFGGDGGVVIGGSNGGGIGIGIGIGGGGVTIGGNPSPSSPPSVPSPNCRPTTPPPPKSRVEIATEVIQEFKKRIECDPLGVLKTWTGRNACEYRGFRCAYLKKYNQLALYSVQFNGLGFSGKNLGIDNFIEKLPDVSIFHANSNNFTGVVPDVGHLPYLYELDLSNNKYQGEFPTAVLCAKKLTYLDIRFNSFVGRVPPQLFTLHLVALFFNNNKFEQTVPANLWSTPAAFLTLANNKFCGHLPPSIGAAGNYLLEVLFLNNKLTGCLPSEISQLKKVRVFDVQKNSFTGPIPHSFACLRNIQYLILAENQLYGPVPEAICKLPKVTNLTLHTNYFTEVGPECKKLIEKKVLDVSMNCIPGLPNQRCEEDCQKFLSQPKTCPEAQEICCQGKAAYLTGEVSVDPPHPQPTLTYSALAPSSN